MTAVINAFTQWIEANQGLVTAFAVTVAGAAGLAVVLIAIGVAAKGAAAGITVVQTAIKGFTFLQGVAIAQGTALKTSFTLLTQFRRWSVRKSSVRRWGLPRRPRTGRGQALF